LCANPLFPVFSSSGERARDIVFFVKNGLGRDSQWKTFFFFLSDVSWDSIRAVTLTEECERTGDLVVDVCKQSAVRRAAHLNRHEFDRLDVLERLADHAAHVL